MVSDVRRTNKSVAFGINNDYGVMSFFNVCFEEADLHTELTSNKFGYNETRRIVLYNRKKEINVQIVSSTNAITKRWPVTFRRGSIPITHTVINSTDFAFQNPVRNT